VAEFAWRRAFLIERQNHRDEGQPFSVLALRRPPAPWRIRRRGSRARTWMSGRAGRGGRVS